MCEMGYLHCSMRPTVQCAPSSVVRKDNYRDVSFALEWLSRPATGTWNVSLKQKAPEF